MGSREAVDLGDGPPIRLGASDPALRIGLRQAAAVALMGAAGATLMGGALFAALGGRAAPGAAQMQTFGLPQFVPQVVAEEGRGDRRVRWKSSQTPKQEALQIEQLGDSGAVRSFTRVSARLAGLAVDPKPEGAAPERIAAATPGSEASPPLALPAVILFGTSHPPIASRRTSRDIPAYAEMPPAIVPKDPLAFHPQIRAPVAPPKDLTSVARSPATPDDPQRIVVARAGDTLSGILGALTIPPKDARAIVAAFPRRRWFGEDHFAGGETVTIEESGADGWAPAGSIMKISVDRPDEGAFWVARTDAGGYSAMRPERVGLRIGEEDSSGAFPPGAFNGETLRDSLYALAMSNHVDSATVAEAMRLAGHDFDLDAPLAATDVADLLYAPNELGEGELVYLQLRAQGMTRRYYHYAAPDDGSVDFYDENGRSVTQFLLRKPVLTGRLGDGFGWRIHPVLGDRRFHEGVDYAAAFGSPVAAAGAGVVERIGDEWGYGKYIRILHDLGYATAYAHVSGFPRGLKVGDRVRQGETIAYIGSTGLSTGPHLYYEVWINGRRVDPLRIKLMAGRILHGAPLARFDEAKQRVDQVLVVPQQATASR